MISLRKEEFMKKNRTHIKRRKVKMKKRRSKVTSMRRAQIKDSPVHQAFGRAVAESFMYPKD